MTGTLVDLVQATINNLSRLAPKNRSRVTLKYSGTYDLSEFQSESKKQDYWYHSFYFDNGFVQHGDYDIGQDVGDYGFPQNMENISVLDIGTGSGWFATFFEQSGANVTTTDARGYCDFDVFGRDRYPPATSDNTAPDLVTLRGQPLYFSPVSKGFWIMKNILRLRAEYLNARAYEICPELFGGRKFDLVFMGSILMHLRDPIGALMAAHSVCKKQLIATTYMLPDDSKETEPVMRLWEGGDGGGVSWWVPNRKCLIQWLSAAGFVRFDVDNTVRLTVDTPYRDANGNSSAVNQIQQLVHAFT
jgi:tRNA (mo5U34)-methyltransferase